MASKKEDSSAPTHPTPASKADQSAQPPKVALGTENPQLDMPMSSDLRTRLQTLRRDLLAQHKVLLDGEKISYEKIHGTIQGVNHYLNLVMSDAHFDWLHRISELIVRIDETLDDVNAGMKAGADLIEGAHLLFQTSAPEKESDFMAHYKDALKRNPAAVLGHAQVRRSLLSDA